MTFKDYHMGTAYIDLVRSDFKDSHKFDDYCRFLCLPVGNAAIRVPIAEMRHKEFVRNGGKE